MSWPVPGSHPQAPTRQELGKSLALAQQVWVLISPPVAVHKAALFDAASLTPPSFGHSPSDFLETPAMMRSQSFEYVLPSQPQTGCTTAIHPPIPALFTQT